MRCPQSLSQRGPSRIWQVLAAYPQHIGRSVADPDGVTQHKMVGFILDGSVRAAHTYEAKVPHMMQSIGDQTGMWTGPS